MLMQRNITKWTWVKMELGGILEIVDITEIYEVSTSIYFVSEGQNTQPLIVFFCQVVTGRNMCQLFSDELDNGNMMLCSQLMKKMN
jgi:hypothetical protein